MMLLRLEHNILLPDNALLCGGCIRAHVAKPNTGHVDTTSTEPVEQQGKKILLDALLRVALR